MTLLEHNLRLELSQLDPMEALFKLTIRIAQTSNSSNLRMECGLIYFESTCTNMYKALSKELVETGRIAPPN